MLFRSNNVNIKRIREELVESDNIGMSRDEFVKSKFALLKNIGMRPRLGFVEAFNSIASLIGNIQSTMDLAVGASAKTFQKSEVTAIETREVRHEISRNNADHDM